MANNHKSRAAPAFQFYADDFLAGTIEMSDEEVGAYTRMLCVQWTKGGVDPARSCRLSDPEVVKMVLSEKFSRRDDGLFVNERLEQVREIQQSRKQSASKGGSKSQANRQAKVQANSQAKGVAKLNSPSPSPSPSPSSSSSPDSISKETPCSPPKGDVGTVDQFFQRWNVFAEKTPKLTVCRKLTSKRRDKIRSRLACDGWFEDFREAVRSLPLGGDGWQPNLDWLIRNDHNIYLLLEGSFDWRAKDDPAAERLAKQRRKSAFEERQKEEQWQQKLRKDESAGTAKAIRSTLAHSLGDSDGTAESSLLFGSETDLSASGAGLSSHGIESETT